MLCQPCASLDIGFKSCTSVGGDAEQLPFPAVLYVLEGKQIVYAAELALHVIQSLGGVCALSGQTFAAQALDGRLLFDHVHFHSLLMSMRGTCRCNREDR